MPPKVKLDEPANYYQSQSQRLIKVVETAGLIGFSENTVYNRISEINQAQKAGDQERVEELKRRLPPFKKIGRSVRFDIREVEKWITEL
jgi:predicted DNA-binding transcriptional regulator AlpA